MNDQYVKEEEVKDLEDHTNGSIPPADHTTVNNIKGLRTSRGNCRGGNIILNPSKFSFPSMTLPKYDVNVVLWRHSKNHFSLQNAWVQRYEAGKGCKTKALKYENLSEKCHESCGNIELE